MSEMEHGEGEWAVSTKKVYEYWETAINRPENGLAEDLNEMGEPVWGYKYKWRIVEEYDDREAATHGHDKWVKLMQNDPHQEMEVLE